tara:strand:+ start:455 stop:1444 length:990 start_codon:yes stop_codon:yes gene_type:complete
MKKLPLFLFLAVLNSCGDGNKNDDKKVSKVNPEDLVNTRYIKANEIACNYTNGEEDFDANNLNGEIISGFLQTEFDIIFPKNISFKIIKELKESSARGEKVTSNNFWSLLSQNGQSSLNDYLIKNYGTLKDKEFNTKRRLTAYAFTIFTEIENYQQAITIKATSSKLFKEFTVAFSYDIRERIKLDHCLDRAIKNVEVPINQLLPSKIVTNVICEDFYGENTVSFQIHKDNKMYLTVDTDILLDKVEMNVEDVKISNLKRYKRLNYNDNEHEIDVRIYKKKTSNAYYDVQSRSFIYDTIKYLNIEFKRKGHQNIELTRLDCRAIKPFVI